MADRRDKRRRQEARRRAHLERVNRDEDVAASSEARRQQRRDDAARSAEARVSAARWLVPRDDDRGRSRSLDVVAELLSLDPRTRLRGRGDEQLRGLAAQVEGLVGMGVEAPSGRALLDVLVDDEDERAALAPTLDLDALLAEAPASDQSHDRTVRLAEALLARAAQHRNGGVDLHALVAPVGVDRHPVADEVEAIVRLATEHVTVPPNAAPAAVVDPAGWIAVSPVELFLTAARGLLDGRAQQVGGGALYAWLDGVMRDPGDPWWLTLSGILDVDVPPLLQQAAARAGSDHPDVAGSILTEMIALRHPLL